MPIKNMWSLNPGEVLTAERVSMELPDCQVYFPLHDQGIDLLLVRGTKQCSIQVKESRLYETQKYTDSWHQLSETNVFPKPESRKIIPDFFVFLTYVPEHSDTKLSSFGERFIIVPIADLKGLLKCKIPSKGKYSFNFVFLAENEVREIREHKKGYKDGAGVRYTDYLEKWDLLSQVLC